MNSQQTETEKRYRVPVRRRDVIEREKKIKREHRQTKPEQKENLELLVHPSPAPDHGPRQRAEEQRRVKYEMFAEEFECLERPKADVFRQTAACLQMRRRDPGMLRVPDDRRDGADNKTSEQPV